MRIRLEVLPDAEAAAQRVAALVAERVAEHAAASPSQSVPGTAGAWHPQFSLALSRARPELVAALAEASVPWERVTVFQVDERVARLGSDERNLTRLLEVVPAARVRPLPVDEPGLEAAAKRYEQELPAALHLVHLGLGTDGHTASLLPGDPVLEVRDRLVAVTQEHSGNRRLTLTYPALEAARELVWLVTGEDKREALRRLLDGDESIPAALIANRAQLVVADGAAAATTAS